MSASKIEPLKKPFNLRSLADRIEIRRLIKSAQRHGLVHIPRKQENANPPKRKLQLAVNS